MAESNENDSRPESGGLIATFKEIFKGFNPKDASDASTSYDTGAGRLSPLDARNMEKNNTGAAGDELPDYKLPDDRFSRYQLYQTMIKDPVISAAIEMHLSHALSIDDKTGKHISIEPVDPEFQSVVDEINEDLGELIQHDAISWARNMCQFGVSYIRPYALPKVGVTHTEFSYYTLPSHIREYERCGMLAGYTHEALLHRDGKDVRLADPWTLVGFKIPFWQPDINIEPFRQSGKRYDLYELPQDHKPIETQNYGTSFLENTLEPYLDLREAVLSLRASRKNASRIDRLIMVATEGLDSGQAAKYIRQVSTQLQKNMQYENKRMKSRGVIPTVWNNLIPVLGGGKQGMNIDTQTISPDIQHIEDILFHLRRMCSTLGIDFTMLGWADHMSGGLGEGGFFRTSIQAALRANWIRVGMENGIHRLIEIHLAYKHGKVWPRSKRPYRIEYHSLNTAIAQEESAQRDGKANFAMVTTQIMDLINQGSMAKSDDYKKWILTDQLDVNEDLAEKFIKKMEEEPNADAGADREMASGLASSITKDDQLMESAGLSGHSKKEIEAVILEVLTDLNATVGELTND